MSSFRRRAEKKLESDSFLPKIPTSAALRTLSFKFSKFSVLLIFSLSEGLIEQNTECNWTSDFTFRSLIGVLSRLSESPFRSHLIWTVPCFPRIKY